MGFEIESDVEGRIGHVDASTRNAVNRFRRVEMEVYRRGFGFGEEAKL